MLAARSVANAGLAFPGLAFPGLAFLGLAFLILLLLGIARPAQALPMTYAFDMPAFTAGGFAGQTSTLEVTVDNGGTSVANQFYFSFDIDGFAVTVGSAAASLGQESSHGSSMFGNLLYITTDALGIPTLDLTATRESSASFNSPAGERIRLSTGGYLGFPNYSVVIGGVDGTLRSDILVTGRRITAIPEAPGLTLLGLGLIGLVLIGLLLSSRRLPVLLRSE